MVDPSLIKVLLLHHVLNEMDTQAFLMMSMLTLSLIVSSRKRKRDGACILTEKPFPLSSYCSALSPPLPSVTRLRPSSDMDSPFAFAFESPPIVGCGKTAAASYE